MLQIFNSPKLAELTSLHLGGEALARVSFDELRDVDLLPARLKAIGGGVVLLGGGTNILAPDGTLPLTLLSCNREGITCVENADGSVTVRGGAGVKLPRLLAWCAKRGFGGLEGMAGVPGSLGGAVAGNAGAQGMDMGSVLSRVTLFSPESGVRTLSRPEVTCTYRHFAPHTREISACSSAITLPCPAAYTDDWYVIIEVEMQLRKERPEVIMQTMRSLMARKMRVQPVRAWSAGCLFRNPEPAESSLPAGKLLDEAGFRGKRHGGVCLSPMHANFLVHEGNGSAKAALELIFEARETVHSRFGVLLRPEVKLWVC